MNDILQYAFFQNALLASFLAAILCGLVGTYIVARRLVFIAGGLAHASLGGVGVCALVGLPPILGAGVFSLLSAFGVKQFNKRMHISEDAAVSLLWAFGMSVGVMCAFHSPSFLPDLPNYIFGNILLTNRQDLWVLGILTILTACLFLLFLPQITTLAFDREFAQTMHLHVNVLENLMLGLVTLSIVAILRSTGIILAISLLSIPQITAALYARSFTGQCLASILVGLADCLLGLFLSYQFNVPSGAAIVFVSVLIYTVFRTIKALTNRFKR